ncbi:MAG TPA: hypothetical protein PL033_11315 [Candidatus Brocadiia bacterium]|nr:hypothetical protein [Candidatus Brocadiia bacterium]
MMTSSSTGRGRTAAALGCVVIIALVLYGDTLTYSFASDDFPCWELARDRSGPFYTLFIGRDTLKNVLPTQNWVSGVIVKKSDIFRPVLVWYYKVGQLFFGKWEPGYRLMKLLLLVSCSLLLYPVALEFLKPSSGCGRREDDALRLWAAAASAMFAVNFNNQWVMVREVNTFETYAMMAGVLICVAMHNKWVVEGLSRSLVLGCAGLVFGLCSRENALAIVLAAPLIDWALGRQNRRAMIAYGFYAGICAAYIAARYTYYGGEIGAYGDIRSGGDVLATVKQIYSEHRIVRDSMLIARFSFGPMHVGYVVVCATLTGGALFLLTRRTGVAILEGRRILTLAVLAGLFYGPGVLIGMSNHYLLLPSACIITAVALLASRASLAAAVDRRLWIAACAPLLGLYIAGSGIARWGDAIPRDVAQRAEQIRREVRAAVVGGVRPDAKHPLVVFLALPNDVHDRFDLFYNSAAAAAPFWTDGRATGVCGAICDWFPILNKPNTIAVKRSGRYSYEMQTISYTLGFDQIHGLEAQRIFASNAWYARVQKGDLRPDKTHLFKMILTMKGEFINGFDQVLVIYHDGIKVHILDS